MPLALRGEECVDVSARGGALQLLALQQGALQLTPALPAANEGLCAATVATTVTRRQQVGKTGRVPARKKKKQRDQEREGNQLSNLTRRR